MADARPLPEYGEYATPEEQARAMGLSHVPTAPVPSAALPAPDPNELIAVTPVATVARTGFANRFFTIFLLGIGALALLRVIPSFLDFAATFRQAFKAMGYDVTVPASFGSVGIWLLIVNAVLYLATLVWAIWALRAGRRSAYIPVVGFALFLLVWTIVLYSVDPGLSAQLTP